MDTILIIAGISLLLAITYIGIGLLLCKKICFVKRRSFEQLYRNELKQNFPHSLINPPHKKLYIKSRLGYDMAARLYDGSSTHKYCLLLHGYNNSSVTCGKYSLLFNAIGINCLAPDLRRSGETNGKGVTFGYFEEKDVEQWIEEIYKIDPLAEIGIFGISLGAATGIMVAARRPDIKYLISYCSFSSFKDIILDKGGEKYKNLIKVLYPALIFSCNIITKARLDLVDLTKEIKDVTCPTLIMHSKGDAFTSIRHAEKLHLSKPDAQYRTFDKAAHARAYSMQPELFKQYLYEFLNSIK